MCGHVLPLYVRNMGGFPPSFSPSEREVVQKAWRHRMDGDALDYSYGRYCERSYEKYFQIFFPCHSFPFCARREGEVARFGLHHKGTTSCPGGTMPCGAASVESVVMSLLC